MTGPTVALRGAAAQHNLESGADVVELASWPGLSSAAQSIDVPLDEGAIARFDRYRNLLLEWNARLNLTAMRDADAIDRVLILDALAMIPTLDQFLDRTERAKSGVSLIDIGSGAGFPGLVLKIARPDLNVTLVDATAKKVAFLTAAIDHLELTEVRALHGRAETLGQDQRYRGRFDLATARAVASLPVLLEYVVPLLRIGGSALMPKGIEIADELRAGRQAAGKLGARIVSADQSALPTTRLVVAEKIAPTPGRYPRRIGVPSQCPLPGEN